MAYNWVTSVVTAFIIIVIGWVGDRAMVRHFFYFFLMSVAVAVPVRAELRLDEWRSYSAMAEQGGICAAFASVMELQGKFDEAAGNLWFERRKYAGAVVREASILEGLAPATATDIDALIASYVVWLVGGLSKDSDTSVLDPQAHKATTQMIADTCGGLYRMADQEIYERLPELAHCAQTKEQPVPKCDSILALQTQLDAQTEANATLQSQLERLTQTSKSAKKMAVEDTAVKTTSSKNEPATITQPLARPNFTVQVGSYQSYEKAVSGVVILREAFPDLLNNITIAIQKTKLGTTATVFRLMSHRLNDSRGTAICTALSQSGFGCLLHNHR